MASLSIRVPVVSCPFCNSDDLSLTGDDYDTQHVFCNTCHAWGPAAPDVSGLSDDLRAIALWNKRATEVSLPNYWIDRIAFCLSGIVILSITGNNSAYLVVVLSRSGVGNLVRFVL